MRFALQLTERGIPPGLMPPISQASSAHDKLWEICDRIRNYVAFSVSGLGEEVWDLDPTDDLPSILLSAVRQLRVASIGPQQIGTFLFTFGLQGLERQIFVQRQYEDCLLEMLDARTQNRTQDKMLWGEYERMLERFVSTFQLFAGRVFPDFRWETLLV